MMHKPKSTLFVASILVLGSTVFAVPGTPIPIPDLTIEKAIELARAEHKKMVSKSGDHAVFKEMTIVSVEYISQKDILGRFERGGEGRIRKVTSKDKWQWIVCFTNPTQNDVSCTYLITQDGKAIVVSTTW